MSWRLKPVKPRSAEIFEKIELKSRILRDFTNRLCMSLQWSGINSEQRHRGSVIGLDRIENECIYE